MKRIGQRIEITWKVKEQIFVLSIEGAHTAQRKRKRVIEKKHNP